jgi:hypothetical protein
MAKAVIAVILCLSFVAPVAAAAPVQPKAAASQTKPAKPDWFELTPAQQNVLAPLKEDWGSLDTMRRKKWIKVADAYPKMKPAEQQRLQTRMKDWAKLTPEQRRVAREKYLALKKMPPAKREQVKMQWQQYQQSLAAKSEPDSQEIVSGQEPASSGTQQ